MIRTGEEEADRLWAGASCIIVDSTRRGKSMPDALAKTIPIWCVVINRLLFGDRMEHLELHTPSHMVGSSEHAQINARLDGFRDDAEVTILGSGSDFVFAKRSGLIGSPNGYFISSNSLKKAASPFLGHPRLRFLRPCLGKSRFGFLSCRMLYSLATGAWFGSLRRRLHPRRRGRQ